MKFLRTLGLILSLTMTAAAQSSPSLQWTANPASEAVTSYKVYEHVGTVFNLVSTVVAPATTYSLAGVVGPKLYSVSAVNVAGEGPRCADVTFPATPTAPAGLKIIP